MKKVFQLLAVIAIGLFVQAYSAQATEVTELGIDGALVSVGASGPGWSFARPGLLILTGATLDYINSLSDSTVTGDLEIRVMNGSNNAVKRIRLFGTGTLRITGDGTLTMSRSVPLWYFLESGNGGINITGVAVDIVGQDVSTPGFSAVKTTGILSVLQGASLSVATKNVSREVRNINVNGVVFNTTGNVTSTITFADTIGGLDKLRSRALFAGDAGVFDYQFAGTGTYTFETVGGQQAIGLKANNTLTFADYVGVSVPTDGKVITINGVPTVVDATDNPWQTKVVFQGIYPITKGVMVNGDITISKTHAAYGDVISVAVHPADNYEIESLSYQSESGTTHELNPAQRSFRMNVRAPITVNATFKEAINYTLTLNCGEGAATCDGEIVEEGGKRSFRINVVAEDGYVIKNYTYNGDPDTTWDGETSISLEQGITEHTIINVDFDKLRTVYFYYDYSYGSCLADPEKSTYRTGDKIDLQATTHPGFDIASIIINGAAQPITDLKMWAKTWYVNEDLHIYVQFQSEITDMAITSPPSKTTYTEGEQLDLFGMVVLLTKSDGTTESVAYGDFEALGIRTSLAQGTALNTTHNVVTIKHMESGKTVTQPITVIPEPIISAPIHRFYSEQFRAHFYTISEQEKQHIQQTYDPYTWNYEGIAYNASQKQATGMSPIHRFYSLTNKKHFYTISEEEKNKLIAGLYPEAQFQYEGIAWYANTNHSSTTRPLHRFYSTNSAVHFYTTSEEEKNYIIATYPPQVWSYEGVAWYALQ